MMTAMAEPMTDDVTVPSTLLGPLEVMRGQLYDFPDELYGFTGAREFALIPAERDGFFWLQSVDFEALTFLLIDPFQFVEGYTVDIPAEDMIGPGSDDTSSILILAMLTLPREAGETATVNLQGPLAFSLTRNVGKQVVVESSYGIRHPVTLSSDGSSEG